MASKTIEQDNDRRLTIMTATFIPCGAKLPVIALMGGVMAGYVTGWDVAGMMAPIMYFVGICLLYTSCQKAADIRIFWLEIAFKRNQKTGPYHRVFIGNTPS